MPKGVKAIPEHSRRLVPFTLHVYRFEQLCEREALPLRFLEELFQTVG